MADGVVPELLSGTGFELPMSPLDPMSPFEGFNCKEDDLPLDEADMLLDMDIPIQGLGRSRFFESRLLAGSVPEHSHGESQSTASDQQQWHFRGACCGPEDTWRQHSLASCASTGIDEIDNDSDFSPASPRSTCSDQGASSLLFAGPSSPFNLKLDYETVISAWQEMCCQPLHAISSRSPSLSASDCTPTPGDSSGTSSPSEPCSPLPPPTTTTDTSSPLLHNRACAVRGNVALGQAVPLRDLPAQAPEQQQAQEEAPLPEQEPKVEWCPVGLETQQGTTTLPDTLKALCSSRKDSQPGAAPVPMEPACRSERAAAIARYREKKKRRAFTKKIRYQMRKINAERRPRVKGRFVKRSEMDAAALAAAEQGAAPKQAMLHAVAGAGGGSNVVRKSRSAKRTRGAAAAVMVVPVVGFSGDDDEDERCVAAVMSPDWDCGGTLLC